VVNKLIGLFGIVAIIGASACATTTSSTPTGGGSSPAGAETARSVPSRPLVIAVGRPPESLGAKPLRQLGGPASPVTSQRLFSAGMTLHDEREVPRPYLVEALPQANTEDWRVFPDGRMETTYRLRPGLTWHDGKPLNAMDFAFSYRVYATPELGHAESVPVRYMEEVVAQDPQTLIIRWRQVFAGADDLQARDFPPLPRHLLEETFEQVHPDSFVSNGFWINDFVGAGPYRLTRWEHGTFLEGEAFPGHALGSPRIERIRLTFITDPNTALANLLSGAVHAATDSSLQTQQAIVLNQEWSARNGGTVFRAPVGVRNASIQLRPEFVNPRALLDVRVRKALAYSTDRQSLADGLTDGIGAPAETLVLPQVEYFPALERAVTKYPLDLRRAEQLFAEAGFVKGSDGLYASPTDGRFTPEISVTDANPNEGTIMVDGLRRTGIDASLRVIPRVQTTEPMIFQNFASVLNGAHDRAFLPPIDRLRASQIGRPENRFLGSNFSGFNNAEFERWLGLYESTLNRTERNDYAVAMMKVVSEEVPVYPLYHNLLFSAHVSNLSGPLMPASRDVGAWNIHEWHWTS
jgi:peptide/nickel transport system substrate-binding protein